MFEIISNMGDEIKKSFLDYIEGMPITDNKEVKMKLNHYYPLESPQVILDIHSTLIQPWKYSKDVKITYNPKNTSYQSHYCNVMHYIDELRNIPIEVKNELKKIMHSQFYDSQTFCEVEAAIGVLLRSCADTLCPHVAFIISNWITPYMCKTYDLYSYINSYELNVQNDWYLWSIHNEILKLIKNDSLSFIDISNISALIYLFYKEIGAVDCVEKYNLFDKFAFTLRFYDNDKYTEDIYNELRDMINGHLTCGDVIDAIYSSSNIRFIKFQHDDSIKSYDIRGNASTVVDNVIFTFKNLREVFDDLYTITDSLKRMSADLVVRYTDFCDNPEVITFELNDNDYGQVKTKLKSDIGVAFIESNYESYYITKYDNRYYVLFKHKSQPNIVYAIELTNDIEKKRIISTKHSDDYYFKYIHTI